MCRRQGTDEWFEARETQRALGVMEAKRELRERLPEAPEDTKDLVEYVRTVERWLNG